jgi:hypothetical protein
LHNLHEQIFVHPKPLAKFLQFIYCIVCKIVRVQQQGVDVPAAILVRRLPTDRAAPAGNGVLHLLLLELE